MQKKTLRKGVLLAGALASTLTLAAQQVRPVPQKLRITEANVAVVFSLERAQVAQSGTPTFWLKGAAIDASATFYKGLGLAVNLTGEHASNIQSNVNLGKVAYMVGPRYTLNTSRYTDMLTKKRSTQVFGEWLFGGAHAFDSTFPGLAGATTSANSVSMQMGGGLNVNVGKGFGIRAMELDWVHTNLPNNAANKQNDLRIAFGITHRL